MSHYATEILVVEVCCLNAFFGLRAWGLGAQAAGFMRLSRFFSAKLYCRHFPSRFRSVGVLVGSYPHCGPFSEKFPHCKSNLGPSGKAASPPRESYDWRREQLAQLQSIQTQTHSPRPLPTKAPNLHMQKLWKKALERTVMLATTEGRLLFKERQHH